jgi:predicted ester cyclase
VRKHDPEPAHQAGRFEGVVDDSMLVTLGRDENVSSRGKVLHVRGIKPIFRTLLSAFPDLSLEIIEVLAEPDRAAVRVLVTGTHEGELFGVSASGKTVRFPIHEFHQFEGDRLRRTWHLEDLFGLFTQIGAWPRLAPDTA